jgi:hypothetical protein
MSSISNGKSIIMRLESIWQEIAAAKGLSREFVYRMEKLAFTLDAVAHKLFIKTVKARHVLIECEHLTEQFRDALNARHHRSLMLLTRLEGLVEGLIKETYAFRIKAG